MKKFLLTLALLASVCVFAQATTSTEKDADILLNKMTFTGVLDVTLRPNYSFIGERAGHLLMDVNVEYNVPKDKFITISEMVAKVIVMDDTLGKDELVTYAYSDFCDISQPGCVLRDYFKKYECGDYVNVQSEDAPRRSVKFDGGQNTMKMTFDFGSLINVEMSQNGNTAMGKLGYASPSNEFVVERVALQRLFFLANTLNGPKKNQSKLILVVEGNANYNGEDGTVRLDKIRMAVVLSRKKVDYLYENPIQR